MKFFRFLLLMTLTLSLGYLLRGQFFKKPGIKAVTGISKEQIADAKTEQVQEFSMFGFSESGQKAWEMRGKTADILTEVINLSEIDGNSYGEDVTVNLKADEGVFNRTNNNMVLKKNVVAITDEGTKLTTEKLCWDAKEELMDTDKYVLIEREDMDIEGIGAACRPNLKKAKLHKEVIVKVKDPAAVITCDGPLEVDYEKNIAYFYNNVKVDDKKAQIYSDKSTAYFDPKSRKLTHVYNEGNVKIVRGEDVSYSDDLTYLPDEGRAVLTGRPKIVIRSTEELMEKSKKKPQKNESAKDRKSD